MRKSVKIFSEKMETKLKRKDDSHGENGWLEPQTTVSFLIDRLKEEVIELDEAFEDSNNKGISEEAVDIANFCMMISDRIRGRYKE